MKIEVLVATMFQKNFDFLSKLKLKSSAIVINQTDNADKACCIIDEDFKVLMVSSLERGLSNSRNEAISNAKGDICVIADDDITYFKNYVEIIHDAYQQLSDADVIIF